MVDVKRLRGSAAHRWVHCVGSVALVEELEDKGRLAPGESSSWYAVEGQIAHEVGAMCLRHGWQADADHREQILDAIRNTPGAVREEWDEEWESQVNEEMCEAVQAYLEYCRALNLKQAIVETTFETMTGASGTADYGGLDDDNFLHVVDYKHGKGVDVVAEGNEQLLMYADGLLNSGLYPDAWGVVLHVVQPRSLYGDKLDSWQPPAGSFGQHKQRILDAAEQAHQVQPGQGLSAGEHCTFCPALALCPQHQRDLTTRTGVEFDAIGDPATPVGTEVYVGPELIPLERLCHILEVKSAVISWLNSIESYLGDELRRDGPLAEQIREHGFALKERSGHRYWLPARLEELEKKLRRRLKKSEIYEQPKIRSPAQIEGLAKKAFPKGVEWLKEYYDKPVLEPGIAMTKDKRPEAAPNRTGSEFDALPVPEPRLSKRARDLLS